MTTCRVCREAELDVVLDLGEMPLANAFLTADDLDKPEPRYPLRLAFCRACSLAQITDVIAPEVLFREYAYFSSTSDAMVAHAKRLVDRLIDERALTSSSLAMEIASNDGYLLRHYVSRGVPVLGIDPAGNVAAVANANGIRTIPEFFGRKLASRLVSEGQWADVIHANNVMAHVPDLDDVLGGIAMVLKRDGAFVIETPYVRELVDRLEFDTIYHEHVFYYSLSALRNVLRRHGLAIVDVERIPIHGGSLRVTAMHEGAAGLSDAVASMLAEEERIGLGRIAYFADFGSRVEALKTDLLRTITDLAATSRVAAYGAAAKGTVLLNFVGLGPDLLEFVADRSPHKQGLFMPGVRLPIRSDLDLERSRPDVCLLLAWNFADEILAQQSAYREAGGRFLLPIPAPRFA